MPISEQVERELEAAAAACGCELVHAGFRGDVLQLVVDREGGVTLDDCAAVSRQASAQLDVIDFGKTRYVLEVSSPGLDRQLYRPRDWERFTGRRLRVTWRDAGTGRKRTAVARLDAFEPASSEAVLTVEAPPEEVRLRLEEVEKAKLEVDW